MVEIRWLNAVARDRWERFSRAKSASLLLSATVGRYKKTSQLDRLSFSFNETLFLRKVRTFTFWRGKIHLKERKGHIPWCFRENVSVRIWRQGYQKLDNGRSRRSQSTSTELLSLLHPDMLLVWYELGNLWLFPTKDWLFFGVKSHVAYFLYDVTDVQLAKSLWMTSCIQRDIVGGEQKPHGGDPATNGDVFLMVGSLVEISSSLVLIPISWPIMSTS